MDAVKEYWRIYLGVLFVFIGGVFILMFNRSTTSIEAQENSLRTEIQEIERELAKGVITEDDLAPEVEVIEQSGAHARDMGKEMIQVQKKLSDAYRTPDPVVDYKDKDGLDKAEVAYTRMTNSSDYINTWMLNPEWSMELDSIGNYVESKHVPVVFSLYLKDGGLAGMVRASYDSERDLMKDIVVSYTVDGYNDAVDVGGR